MSILANLKTVITRLSNPELLKIQDIVQNEIDRRQTSKYNSDYKKMEQK